MNQSPTPFASPRSVLGLLLMPATLGLACLLAPHVQVCPDVADAISFFGAVLSALAALAVLSGGVLSPAARLSLLVAAPAVVLCMLWQRTQSREFAIVVGGTLVAFSHVLGDGVGRHIDHPSHLLPACVVASCADIISVFHPRGPSHAIVSNPAALAALTISFPVMGTRSLQPSIGVADLVFVALLLAAGSRHGLPGRRMIAAIAFGLVTAGLLSLAVNQAVPALPTIGAFVVIGVPQTRNFRERERHTAVLFMVVAVTATVSCLVWRS